MAMISHGPTTGDERSGLNGRTALQHWLALLTTVSASAVYAQGGGAQVPVTTLSSSAVGPHIVRTLPSLPYGLVLRSGTFTPSGKILVSYQEVGAADPREIKLATIDDDGRNFRPFFVQRIPDRPKDNGIRFMVFQDNKRIYLGDFVVECATSLETCKSPKLLPVAYPAEVASGDHIGHRWSEMIIAPDNRHVAWTTLLSNYAAVVLVGELERKGQGYVIARPQIVSTLDPFVVDPRHAEGVLPQVVRGGEVKQFVHAGTGISLAGAVRRDTPDTVVQHLGSGEVEPITDTPGYTETTIFSPDERLGMTMATRFSVVDPAILGLVPRPYPASLNMGLSMFAYTYAVTGVRASRPGNVGLALIDIQASKAQQQYTGLNLNTSPDWVFRSPMSWRPGGKKALWVEGARGAGAASNGQGDRRIQIVDLPDYRPGAVVKVRAFPAAIPYATSDLSVIPGLVKKSRDIDVKVYCRVSGQIAYRRTPTHIEKTYTNYSDDGRAIYAGRETTDLNPTGTSTYVTDLRVTGAKTGAMDLKLSFGPLGGERPARINFDRDASGVPLTHGFAEYDGQRLTVETLAP